MAGSPLGALFVALAQFGMEAWGRHWREQMALAVARRIAPSARHALEPGDVIGVGRGHYQHYGIWAGPNHVIHYTDLEGGGFGRNRVQETPYAAFRAGAPRIFLLDFAFAVPRPVDFDGASLRPVAPAALPSEFSALQPDLASEIAWLTRRRPPVPALNDGPATLAAARARLGERAYDLLSNNCEHFAFQCRTGVSQSTQIDWWLGLLRQQLALPEARFGTGPWAAP